MLVCHPNCVKVHSQEWLCHWQKIDTRVGTPAPGDSILLVCHPNCVRVHSQCGAL